MKRALSTTMLAALVTASLFALGCNKDKKDDKNAKTAATNKAADDKGAATAAKTTDQASTAPDPAASSAAPSAADLAFFPADSDVVVTISLASLKGSAMWAQYLPIIEAQMDKEMADIKAGCGMDPIAKIESVSFGGKAGDDKKMVFVVKGFEKEELNKCIEAMSKKDGKAFSAAEEDGLTHYKFDKKDNYAVWTDAKTVVFGTGGKDFVKERAGRQNGLDTNAAFTALMSKIDGGATIWAVATITKGGELAKLAAMAPGAQGVAASLKLTDGLELKAGVRFDKAESATAALAQLNGIVQMAKAKVPQFASLIDKTKLAANATDLDVMLALSGAELQQLSALGAGMMGGGMGGMGGGLGAMPHGK
jgi:hypothetical protein